MPLQIIRNDITKLRCDAIVNAANSTLSGGGGVDGAIHKAAGPGLLQECSRLGGCKTGEAKITGAYDLPCKYVIHTVGPRWNGGENGEEALLISCYRASLSLAKENKCATVAFPLISSGIYGYPKAEALQIAVETIRTFLQENEMLVYLVIFDRDSFVIGNALFTSIQSFIDDRYASLHADTAAERLRKQQNMGIAPQAYPTAPAAIRSLTGRSSREGEPPIAAQASAALESALSKIDESFTQMLLRKIDEKGMTDSQCYKKANVDRKLFSKIRSDKSYHPSKTTAIAFAIALELDLRETRELLEKAGFALSRSNKFDIIIEYFITNGNYNIYEINEALFAFDQNLLGA